MRTLDDFELAAISGGDNWGSEAANEDNGSYGSYNTGSSGIWGGSSSVPSWACSALGAGAGIAAGLITTGGLGVASALTAGTTLPGAPVVGTIVGGVVGGYVNNHCNQP